MAKSLDFDSIPVDAYSYVFHHADKLSIIPTEVKNNVIKSQQNMLDRANEHINPLQVGPGDYVYLHSEITGAGQNLRNKYTGPFVIEKIPSPHLAILRNPDTNVCLKTPVHFNRLKMAYLREPNPIPYFMSKVVTREHAQQTDTCTDAQSAHNVSDRHDVTVNAEALTDE